MDKTLVGPNPDSALMASLLEQDWKAVASDGARRITGPAAGRLATGFCDSDAASVLVTVTNTMGPYCTDETARAWALSREVYRCLKQVD